MARSRRGVRASLSTLIRDSSSSDLMEDMVADTQAAAPLSTACVMKPKRELLSLSDEILELIIQQVDRHDELPKLRLTCRKILCLSERHMYRNFVVTLSEEVNINKWRSKLETMPESIKMIKYLTILNQNLGDDGYFYRSVVPCANSYRIQRWNILEHAAEQSKAEFEKAAFFVGSKFRWEVKLDSDQLISFRWRHATTLSYEVLCKIMTNQARSLQELELTMVTPPSANSVSHFARAIEPKIFPKLRKLIYHGLSHTEPIPQNQPARGGRFRMLRPLFRKTHEALEELVLSQDHCISQVGKTPLINGRTFNSFLCDLDDIYNHLHDPCPADVPSVTLNLKKLELGGFKVGTLFNVPSIPTAGPRVRVNLPNLRRLVLNECDMLGPLLKELTLRNQDVHLKEVGFRVKEQREDNHTGDWREVADSLQEFLMSFKGLQVLSVLWHGDHLPQAEKFAKVLAQHHQTLEVYSFDTRTSPNDDMGIFRFTVKPPTTPTRWTDVHKAEQCPQLKEIGFNLPDELCTEGYPALRLLSQFGTLRTAHVRHFPKFANNDSDQTIQFWRDYDGSVTRAARHQAARFAELIALPYFGLPSDTPEDNAENSADVSKPFKLKELADLHAKLRDNKLQPGFSMMNTAIKTSTPLVDPTMRVLRHRADTDFVFANAMRKVQAGTATAQEQKIYDKFYSRVQKLLGLSKPSKNDKPKLRLLIVGDWRYRDQLNLAGPRTWNPEVWSTPRDVASATRRNALGEDDEELDIDTDSDDDDVYGNQWERLRDSFYKEFDVSLRPIFFKITWKAEQDESDSKWGWKARATPLNQSTLEGYGGLGDVKSLEFAWQI